MDGRRIKALLLDLDDTLLINDMEAFIPHYFRALYAYFEPLCPPGIFIEALQAGTRAMFRNEGNNGTNEAVFERVFYSYAELDPEVLGPRFERFYREEFDKLGVHTAPDPCARSLVALAFAQGYQVAIATQPLFPRVAIEARLRWAGVGVDEFAYDFISSYEEMMACKPHPRFFQTILDALGRQPEECLMVGDSPTADMAAGQFGLRTFWVNRQGLRPPAGMHCDAQGELSDLITLLKGKFDAL